jgi:hypothetical protein
MFAAVLEPIVFEVVPPLHADTAETVPTMNAMVIIFRADIFLELPS